MRQPLARVGDLLSHGGSITGGASKTKCNGRAIAREGDPAACAIHGAVAISAGSGSATVKVEGKPAARIGSSTTCGAIVTSGSGNANIG